MKNTLQGTSFSSKNKNKSYAGIPNLEGFSNSQVYTDVYKMLNQNVDYEECKKNTEKNCKNFINIFFLGPSKILPPRGLCPTVKD